MEKFPAYFRKVGTWIVSDSGGPKGDNYINVSEGVANATTGSGSGKFVGIMTLVFLGLFSIKLESTLHQNSRA